MSKRDYRVAGAPHNTTDRGYRELAAAIVKNAMNEYWEDYCILQVAIEDNNKEAEKLAKYSLEEIEKFFKSDWYTDILCGLAPNLTTMRFETFKQPLPKLYKFMRQLGKKAMTADAVFTKARKEGLIC